MMTHQARVLDDADAADPEKGSEAELLEVARLRDNYEANRSLLKSLKSVTNEFGVRMTDSELQEY